MDDTGKALLSVAGAASVVVAVVLFVFSGASFWLNVSGDIAGTGTDSGSACELRLMDFERFLWFEEEPSTVQEGRVVKVGQRFEETFILHGPSDRKHWVEIDCPGYRRYTSPVFPAPGGFHTIELRVIPLDESRGAPPVAAELR